MSFISSLVDLNNKKIILASGSPRRKELLQQIGLTFEIQPADVDENPESYRDEVDYVRQNAESKANWVQEHSGGDLVIGSDTIVVKDSRIYEKPQDHEDAASMLRQLSGKTHQVISGICLCLPEQTLIEHEITDVTFAQLSEHEIDTYLDTGEPFDKAGAYGIQGFASIFIEKIDGCYFNVMGFPLRKFYQMLASLEG